MQQHCCDRKLPVIELACRKPEFHFTSPVHPMAEETVVKLLGGIYLIWLGVTTWRSVRRGVEPATHRRWLLPWAQLGGFGQGLWSNVLNPKAASVYLTLVPQFLTSSRPIAPWCDCCCGHPWSPPHARQSTHLDSDAV
ncbi:LysE family translocator [Streptomyces hirsutus]|uniref:LysE family translocator n=1 Tax=Streptomyces hirsutus TaxID=35620 RepID=UPI0033B79DA6